MKIPYVNLIEQHAPIKKEILSAIEGSILLKLVDVRSLGVAMRGSVPAFTSGGGMFRRGSGCGGAIVFVASMRLRIAAPSNGAPTRSSDEAWATGAGGGLAMPLGPLARCGRG